ncbi:hypothetical protein J3459_010775 [Metarhizium acridum]|uniref:uncharacterized protein n=1 Tax=Metarhizium acridum TaxID=92637 RepID=UPI001C6B38D3|nr:hypothetical protein J3458_019992 [Metarhizium acridum]KAG8422016.1 hypothetical protein J3459_010775 [Metarhizium acridum]
MPLADVWDRSWSDLGHPLLDQAKPQEILNEEQKQFINSLSAKLTLLHSPYTGNVSRGMWDINEPPKSVSFTT